MEKRSLSLAFVALACTLLLGALLSLTRVQAAAPAQAPTITALLPSSAPNDLDTTIVITGSGFVAVPTVTLGSTALADVGWNSAQRLTATVPWGLAPGAYDLTVENPSGGVTTQTHAFTVTQGLGVWATGGPYGGAVQQVIANPVTPTRAYAVVFGVGAFASMDSGEHWDLMVALNNPTRLAFDAQDPDILYVGGSGVQQDTVRSMDGGLTWQVFFDELRPQNGVYMSYPEPHPTAQGVVYVATGGVEDIALLPGEGGIYYSDNYGTTWVTRTQGLTDTILADLAFHPDNPDIMAAAATSGNIFTTTNGGLTWHWAADLDQTLRRIYYNPSGDHEAWIVPFSENQPPSAPYLYKSTDASLSTWVTVPVTDDLVTGGGIWTLAFQGNTIWAAGEYGWTSDDGGDTWTPLLGTDHPIQTIRSFAFPPGGSTVYLGSEMNGVAKSLDSGATWQEKNEGLAGLQVRGLAVPRGQIDTIYVNTFERGILRSDDGGRAWRETAFFHGGAPKGQVLAADPFVSQRVYFGDSCDDIPCVQVSDDRGANWEPVTMTLPAAWDGWTGRTLTVAPHPSVQGRILAGVGICRDTAHCNEGKEPSVVYASDDYGDSWAYLGPSTAISEVLVLDFDTVDPNLVYAGTRGRGLWRSTDGGATWAAAPVPSILDPVEVVDIAPHPDISKTVYVRLYSYASNPNPQPNLFVSDDGGLTWTELPDVDTVFGGRGGKDLVFVPPTAGAKIYALYSSCEAGLCRTLDGATTWEQVPGAPRPVAPGFSVGLVANSDGPRSRLYLGTAGGISGGSMTLAHVNQTIPGLGSLMGGGIYRQTTQPIGTYQSYLPLVLKGPSP